MRLEDRANASDGSEYDPSIAQYRVFNSVMGLLMAHSAARGKNPLYPPDAETLMSAIRLLATRKHDDLGAFASGWHPALDVTHSSRFSTDQVLAGLNGVVVRTVAEILSLTPSGQADYLIPLVTWARLGAPLVTLNYDRMIENVAAGQRGVDVYLGFEDLANGRPWSAPEGSVPLIKLHGSIDWQLTPKAVTNERDLTYAVVERVGSDTETPGWPAEPALIFGGRSKARFDGPFLSLYSVFRVKLRRARHVIVIGYSFRDDHVNTALAEWIADGQAEILTIVDPGFPQHRPNQRWSPHSFGDELKWALADGERECKLQIYREPARSAISRLFP